MERKYQVFISSTFSDLVEERKQVIECLLNAKYIPSGMEMFSASNNEQFKYIKKIIDNCDYYILIIGGRYGSVNPVTNKSYTEMEYEYAKEKGIPILVFPVASIDALPEYKKDADLAQIINFRHSVMSSQKLCKMWKTPAELIGSILSSLAEAISDNPRAGWTRGNSIDYSELLEQVALLQKENQRLRKQNEELQACLEESATDIEDIADGDELYNVRIVRKDRDEYNYLYYDDCLKISWDTIFSLIGPYLKSAKSESDYLKYADSAICTQFTYAYYKKVNPDCLQTIKYQLKNRGLISIVQTENESGNMEEVISLTKTGRTYLDHVITVKSVKNTETHQATPRLLKLFRKKFLR